MKRVAFIIDGQFMREIVFKHRAFYYTPENIHRYCSLHLGCLQPGYPDENRNEEIYRILYYDAEPFRETVTNPMTGKDTDYSLLSITEKSLAFLRDLKLSPNMAVRLGYLHWQGRKWMIKEQVVNKVCSGNNLQIGPEDIIPVLQQKAVDMKLGIDIALIALKRLADRMVVITGDSDFIPAFKLARREGMIVTLDSLTNYVRESLREHADYECTFLKPHMFT